ncbi:MAG TPA: RNA polymerase sporulation sigma factor SigH [Acidimicrobiales bacterium]|nr:RNA polymerase sporulation sigma factor SigH [Acidimicrobiales bacterium]
MATAVGAPLLGENDDVLVERFQAGDMQALDALLTKYRRFARSKVRNYFLVGADADDLEQEGLIGLYKAARDYRVDRAASFPVFAEMCITRQIITAVKAATRQKHQPLNGYVSISTPLNIADDGADPRDELLRDHTITDPADVVIDVDQAESVQASIAQLLSSLEVEVLQLYVGGASYAEISQTLNRHTKAVDNAIQRIKRKVEGVLARRASEERAELTQIAS